MARLSRTPLAIVVAVLGVAATAWLTAAQGGGDEPPPVLEASALLPPDQLKGPNHTVAEAVETPGFFHEFQITSDFGAFAAVGTSQVRTRLNEIKALAALHEVSKTEVFVKAVGGSVAKVGTSAAQAVAHPEATAKGVAGGVKRVGINLGRSAKRAASSATSDDKPAEEGAGNAAAGTANSLLGIDAAMRRWARKVGADPYTTNPTLKKALEDVARVDVSGSLATKIVVPIPAVVGTAAEVGDLVWSQDPEALRKTNEARARELGVSATGAKALFNSPVYTLTMQTRLIAALQAVRVPGAGDYVATAAEAEETREALFFVESAEMLQAFHAKSRVASLLTDSRAVVARTASGQAVALLPLDWVRVSGAAKKELTEMGARAKAELGATSLALRVIGKVTERATREYAALGWAR
jgi:hypothetical protein